MTIFNKTQVNPLEQPLFFGEDLNVARTDLVKHKVIDNLSEKMLGFFWTANEVSLSKDVIDYADLEPHEKHMFEANIRYQSLLDSVQGRSPLLALLPIISDPVLERAVETWSFTETIHSQSYTHILRTLLPTTEAMANVFDGITETPEIMERATSISNYYDEVIRLNALKELSFPGYNEYKHKKAVYKLLHVINALESIRFYVSFAVSFAFGESGRLDGVCKIMSLIARDEALHMKITQYLITQMQRGLEGDEWLRITEECKDEVTEIFEFARKQEKEWAKYLFSLGTIVGLNEHILGQYVDYLTNQRMIAVNLVPQITDVPKKNPIPWITDYLSTENTQVAPQEAEIISYVSGAIDLNDELDLGGLL